MLVSSSVKKQPKKVDQLGESTKKCVVLRVGKGGGGTELQAECCRNLVFRTETNAKSKPTVS